ncbi:RNA methyltransferase, TrmH family [Spiroplasma clarkii]|uniref:TrmH family RNA methyltransferase n=1 Tax=Spiroplasma clarkii TaxID=2139 RepID=UPI000B555627|nr:RNA methyltransferase [Spiroplasma clarkii]ARU91293.1 RNA methyltransferase, TrmH family [Spiroplasma clarkii]
MWTKKSSWANRSTKVFGWGSKYCCWSIKNQVVETIFATKKHLATFKDFKNCIEITDNVAAKLTDLKLSQEVFAVCRIKTNDFYSAHTLVIDGVQDPGNLGTLIRSAAAFGFKNILCSHDTVNLYSGKVLRAIQGQHFSLHIKYCDLVRTLKDLKEQDFLVLGTNLQGGNSQPVISKIAKLQ